MELVKQEEPIARSQLRCYERACHELAVKKADGIMVEMAKEAGQARMQKDFYIQPNLSKKILEILTKEDFVCKFVGPNTLFVSLPVPTPTV